MHHNSFIQQVGDAMNKTVVHANRSVESDSDYIPPPPFDRPEVGKKCRNREWNLANSLNVEKTIKSTRYKTTHGMPYVLWTTTNIYDFQPPCPQQKGVCTPLSDARVMSENFRVHSVGAWDVVLDAAMALDCDPIASFAL